MIMGELQIKKDGLTQDIGLVKWPDAKSSKKFAEISR